MSVDYSAHDFHESRAVIDAASRENIRVRRHGDITVVTEHRDPYSFYWQLDQARPQEDKIIKLVYFTSPRIFCAFQQYRAKFLMFQLNN